jgi:hypothetical protein
MFHRGLLLADGTRSNDEHQSVHRVGSGNRMHMRSITERTISIGMATTIGMLLCLAPAGASTPAPRSGEAHKSAKEILADAKAATASAQSVRISGTVFQNGSPLALNIVSSPGVGGGGTISQAGASLDLVVAPPSVYLNADAESWSKLLGAAGRHLVPDKWIRTTTADKMFGALANMVDLRQLTAAIGPDGKATKGATITFHGRKAVTSSGPIAGSST